MKRWQLLTSLTMSWSNYKAVTKCSNISNQTSIKVSKFTLIKPIVNIEDQCVYWTNSNNKKEKQTTLLVIKCTFIETIIDVEF